MTPDAPLTGTDIAWGVSVTLGVLVIYFLPWLYALLGRHRYTAAIFVINIFLGWTLVGWVGALAWSLCPMRREPKP